LMIFLMAKETAVSFPVPTIDFMFENKAFLHWVSTELWLFFHKKQLTI